ncbi:MAG: hypothetical protein JW985_00740 [Alphaproteobacteria bacterium]|nr:hypothetical protein [Alphaproteobacteria bacterium]
MKIKTYIFSLFIYAVSVTGAFSALYPICTPSGSSCLSCPIIYFCAFGYYGTATSSYTGCVACPANATCSGEAINPSTFTCNSGYYKSSSTACSPCPSNATCTTGTIVCNSGYYLSSSTTCSPCPSNATCTTGSVVCNAGYYYNGSNCVSCVLATGNSNATSSSGSTSITGCYLSAGKTGSNTKGSYIIDTGTCNYAQ